MPVTKAVLAWMLAAAMFCAAATARPSDELLVFAAASLTDALGEIGTQYTRRTRQPLTFSFAASATLARQVEAGARADVFFSADREWMDYLQQRRLIDRATRRDIVGNRLVLVAPADSTIALQIAPHFGLAAALGQGRLATGDPDTVPVGRYARAALTRLGVWDDIAPRLVRADNVRAALAFIARGETPLGIVYQTDARIEPRVRVVAVFPADTHPPIVYPAAATTTAARGARNFLAFLHSAAAGEIFAKHGFSRPPSAQAPEIYLGIH